MKLPKEFRRWRELRAVASLKSIHREERKNTDFKDKPWKTKRLNSFRINCRKQDRQVETKARIKVS